MSITKPFAQLAETEVAAVGLLEQGSESTLSIRSVIRGHRTVIGLAVTASVVASVLALVQPALLNQLIGSIETGQDTWPLLATLVALLLVNVLTASFQQYLVDVTAERIVWSIRSRVISLSLRMPLETLRRISASQVISRVGPDAATLRTALTGGIFDSLGNALLMLGALVAMALVDIHLLFLTLIVVVASFSIVLGAFRITRTSSRKNQEAVAGVTVFLDRALSGIRTIRIYNSTKQTQTTMQALLEGSKQAGVRLARVKALVAPANGLAVQGSVLAVLGVGGFRVAEGSLTIADLVTFVAYLFLAVVPMSQLLSAVSDVSVASGTLDRIRGLFDESAKEERPTTKQPGTVSGPEDGIYTGSPASGVSPAPTVVLEGVSYEHADSGFRVEGVSMSLMGGSMVALVGPSGSGKSTILDLISGLIPAHAGSVRAGQLTLGQADDEAWRSQIAYVEQSHGIISGTVRENLVLGRPSATEQELREALVSVNLARLTARGPRGLDLVIDDGSGLSGGERQRLAIARAIASNRPIILLDEPSANLDADNIEALIVVLQSLRGTRTVLISTHNSQIAAVCDHVLDMQGGVVQLREVQENGCQTFAGG
ncbi:ABC transporter ATP-binding protein [Pseudarthrobacter sp. NPDC058329]|uniref:ABC transporter ATP-binding protein n=1 Tax=Pseudarthrobacter sp. NPDC058329 TaxID=3346448 RepID=UPI0036DCBF10